MSNVFSCTGTIGRDAEVRYLPSGQAVLNVSVANNVGFGDRQQTVWLRVVVWGRTRSDGVEHPSDCRRTAGAALEAHCDAVR